MTTTILSLPFELRKRILEIALRQEGTVELQTPVWAGSQVFAQSLFQTCRLLRDEALEAFYETNDFLWIIDTENESRSDPATYQQSARRDMSSGELTSRKGTPLMPVLPWEYPKLFLDLRYLRVNIWVRGEGNVSATNSRLSAMVEALDHGRRLAGIHFLVIAERQPSRTPSMIDQRLAWETLRSMKVRGSIEVRTRYWVETIR